MQTTGKFVNGMIMKDVNFLRVYPEDNTLEQLAYDISLFFAENPRAMGVEVFVNSADGTPKPIGLVRNPAMRSVFEDTFALYNKWERNTKVRTVEVRWKQ